MHANKQLYFIFGLFIILLLLLVGLSFYYLRQRVVAFSFYPKPYVVIWENGMGNLPFSFENPSTLSNIIRDLRIDKPVILDFKNDPELSTFYSPDTFLVDNASTSPDGPKSIVCLYREVRFGGLVYSIRYLINLQNYIGNSNTNINAKLNNIILYCLVSVPNGRQFVQGQSEKYIEVVNKATNNNLNSVFKLKIM